MVVVVVVVPMPIAVAAIRIRWAPTLRQNPFGTLHTPVFSTYLSTPVGAVGIVFSVQGPLSFFTNKLLNVG